MSRAKRFRDLLRELPVSINNLADPAILLDSSASKLDTLAADGHTGPVALITKGDLSTGWWRERLPGWARSLDLYVFASISHLPREMEPASPESRYRTLSAARDAGCRTIGYIRPIIKGLNDSPETLEMMFRRSVEAGAEAIVSSGFRGDSEVVRATGLESVDAPDGQHWSKTLKITAKAASDHLIELATVSSTPYWTRTACAVAALRGQRRSLNPYHLAPGFVGCERCPIRGSCADTAQFHRPAEGSLELLQHLGFRVEEHTASARYQRCGVERRQDCSLCCTNCPRSPDMGAPYVNLRVYDGSVPSWGEMSLARFLTGGVLATDPMIPPGENSNVRLDPRFRQPDGKNNHGGLYGVNSWMVWSEYLPASKCLRCKYCFLSMFEDVLPPELSVTVGTSPIRILDWEGGHSSDPLPLQERRVLRVLG